MSIVDGFPLQQLTEAFGRLQFTTRGSCVSLEEIQRALLQPIMRGEWQHPFVALVKDSAPPDLSDYTIPNRNLVRELVPTAVVELMRQGYTLKVQNVELGLPSVRRVLNAVEASTGRYGSAVFFMTPHAETGLRPHRDDTDVVVEQIQGSKRWKVWAPTHEACDGLGVGAPTGKCHELLLQSGEFLYVPQGWMHCAQTESATPSIHVSYCLRPAAPQQVAASLRRAADPTTVTVDHVLRELTVTT